MTGGFFLTARWSCLALVTYAVDADLVRRYAHPACEPETRPGGEALVSLVGFRFEECRVAGVRWPGYTHFPEINLRFYVVHAGQRGVGFVREFVPGRPVAWLARVLYNEPYAVARDMRGDVAVDGDRLRVVYSLTRAGRAHRIRIEADRQATVPAEDSLEHALKEHRWGFGRGRRGQLIRYEVQHPTWEVFPVRSFDLDVAFGRLYGADWARLDTATPVNVMLARGSPVGVRL